MMIRSKAPLRISFSGGGTDVSPYFEEKGGVVLSATVDKYAYGSLSFRKDQSITVQSIDYDFVAKYGLDKPLPYDGKLDLVKAVVNRLKSDKSEKGFDIFLHSDAPPGSGLGSSSAVVVTLIGLFKHWLHLPLTNYDVSELAYRIERIDMGLAGGKQDQYAATFGGFNFIEFHKDFTIVNPLRIPLDVINELSYSLLLVYTGKTRLSAGIIDSQVKNYKQRDEKVLGAMDQLKAITIDMKNALLKGKLADFGDLLHQSWKSKKLMAKQISNPVIDELYETARSHGALGGKISGAGAGGYMFVFCPFGRKHIIAEALERLGAQIVDFHFDLDGLQTWEVNL